MWYNYNDDFGTVMDFSVTYAYDSYNTKTYYRMICKADHYGRRLVEALTKMLPNSLGGEVLRRKASIGCIRYLKNRYAPTSSFTRQHKDVSTGRPLIQAVIDTLESFPLPRPAFWDFEMNEYRALLNRIWIMDEATLESEWKNDSECTIMVTDITLQRFNGTPSSPTERYRLITRDDRCHLPTDELIGILKEAPSFGSSPYGGLSTITTHFMDSGFYIAKYNHMARMYKNSDFVIDLYEEISNNRTLPPFTNKNVLKLWKYDRDFKIIESGTENFGCENSLAEDKEEKLAEDSEKKREEKIKKALVLYEKFEKELSCAQERLIEDITFNISFKNGKAVVNCVTNNTE